MIYRALAILILLAPLAHANLWTRTNEINGLSAPNPATLTGTAGQVRMTVYAKDSANAKDLSGLASWFEITDQADGYATNLVATITSATNGLVTGFATLNAGTYTAKIYAGPAAGDPLAFPLTWDTMVITSTPSAGGGGSVSISLSLTNPVTVASSGTGNVVTGITANGSVVTEHRGTVAGGSSGGGLTVQDYTNQTFAATQIQFSVVFKVTTNADGTVFIDRTDLGGLPSEFTATNVATYAPNWSTTLGGSTPTNIYHTFSATTTQAWVKIWGGAANGLGGGNGSSGGYTEYVMAHPSYLKLRTMKMDVGQGSYNFTNAVAGVLLYQAGSWPDGGGGLARSNATSQTGAGSSRIWFGSELLAVAGGAGPSSAHGGGEVGFAGQGGSVATAIRGGRGTQTNGGERATGIGTNPAWTNTAGSFLRGGDAGWATNVNPGISYSTGGGGGYYGGGGGANSTAGYGEGGSGSGWINQTNIAFVYGETIRGITHDKAIKNEEPNYVAGRSVAGSAAANNYGGHGLVIVYER
jgi:hypothetical protein